MTRKIMYIPSIILVLMLAMLLGCQTARKKEVDPRTTEPIKVTHEFDKIQTLYNTGEHRQVISAWKNFENIHPNSAYIPLTRFLSGKSNFFLTRFTDAAVIFKSIITDFPDSATVPHAKFNLAATLFQESRIEEALNILRDTDPDELEVQVRMKRGFLMGKCLEKLDHGYEAVLSYLDAYDSTTDKEQDARAIIRDKVEEPVKTSLEMDDLEDLLDRRLNLYPEPLIRLRLAEILAKDKQEQRAEDVLELLLEKYPDSDYTEAAESMLQRMKHMTEVDPTVLGVVLPLSGRMAKYGKRALNGILYASEFFANSNIQVQAGNAEEQDNIDNTDSTEETHEGITLSIMDEGQSRQQISSAMDQILFTDRAALVIGALTTKSAKVVSRRCQDAGVTNLSLSQGGGIPDTGDFIFRNSITPELMGAETAKYAINTLGLKKFAILYPEDRYGTKTAFAFWKEVEKNGGEITGVEHYPSKRTDFTTNVKKLAGLYYTNIRQQELNLVKIMVDEEHGNKSKRFRSNLIKLKPIIDFDAIFIPDTPKVLGLIAPTLAYFDVIKIPILGTNMWNSKRMMKMHRKYREVTIFPDAYFHDAADENAKKEQGENEIDKEVARIREFRDGFIEMFGYEPGVIEATAYDTAKIAIEAMKQKNIESDRYALRDLLLSGKNFMGINGETSFKENGEVRKNLTFLTIRGRKIIQNKKGMLEQITWDEASE